MSRFGRIRRRPDHWSSPHERARVRAAERLDGPLGLTEATWLDEHLAGCAECAAVAAAYAADRETLQALRGAMPEPPRDLWARTAAAIEIESSARHGGASRPAGRRIPIGALSGLAVIAVVVGVSTMSSGLFLGTSPTEQQALGSADGDAPSAATDTTAEGGAGRALPTPIAVGAGAVTWIDLDSDGTLAYNRARVDEVCPAENKDGCATLADSGVRQMRFSSTPESIIASPDETTAVVVSRNASGAQRMVVVDLPPADEASAPVGPGPTVAPAATQSPEPTTAPASPATESATPSDEPDATPSPSSEPPASETPITTPSVDASAAPSDDPLVAASDAPSASPEATTAASLAIADEIEIIGESAAFSQDGTWFAFTARPAGAETGSDVYLWKVGDADAIRLTADGGSAFASWSGDQVVVSRPMTGDVVGGEAAPTVTAATVTIDPADGTESPASTAWRPAVDPQQRQAVGWSGTVAMDEQGTWHPAEGRLELQPWPNTTDGSGPQVVVEGPLNEFDARWDDAGEWFAVWTADAADPTIGRLSLFHVDPATGLLERPEGAPADVPALPGFSIGDGRLAWATPPGQGGEGSRVQIVAWGEDANVGGIETAPGESLVVVR